MAKKIRTMEVNIGPESHGSRYHLRMGKALWRWLTVEELVDVSSALNGELSRVLRERGEEMNDGERVDGLEKQGEQKHIDKVEPKFKVRDWITDGYVGGQITSIDNNYPCYKIADFMGGIDTSIPFKLQDNYHKWTIQDAKDGDMVVDKSDGTIGIFQSIGHHPDGGSYNDPSYCFLHCRYDDGFFYADFEHGNTIDSDDLIPATKEQRDLLFAKMKEAGYEWDDEKKELKKVEQKHTWSKEDERNLEGIIDEIEANKNNAPGYDLATYDRFLSWLKSLKQRYTWKPSDEQIKALKETCDEHWEPDGLDPLYTLWEQLKKLKGE